MFIIEVIGICAALESPKKDKKVSVFEMIMIFFSVAYFKQYYIAKIFFSSFPLEKGKVQKPNDTAQSDWECAPNISANVNMS